MAGLNIDFHAETNSLSLKLKAIAKHCEALAEELDEIDRMKCPMCGSIDTETTSIYSESPIVESKFSCADCDYSIKSKGYAL